MPTAAVDAGLGIDLPAGRFLRVTVTTDLTIAGQVLSGTFMVEQVSSAGADRVLNTTDDVKILKIAAIARRAVHRRPRHRRPSATRSASPSPRAPRCSW